MRELNYNKLKNSLDLFLDDNSDGSFYIGHASVLFRMSGNLYLIDAVYERPLFLDSWLFFPELVKDKRFLNIDGVFISHFHEDHYDIQFLRDLKKNTPIYITEGREGFDQILNDDYFNVFQIPPYEKFLVDNIFNVLAIPSDHNSFDSSFIMKSNNFALFQGNDNFLDDNSIHKAYKLIGSVDHAYIPYSYVWWYPYCLTSLSDIERKKEADRLTKKNMSIGLTMAKIFNASVVIPSAGNLVYYNGVDSILNREIASPFDFLRFVQNTDEEIAKKTVTLFAGDFVLKKIKDNFIYSQQKCEKEFFNDMDLFLKKRLSLIPKEKMKLKDTSQLKKIKNKIKNLELPIHEYDLFFFADDEKNISIKVSLSSYDFEIVNTPSSYPNSMFFSIEPSAFFKWLNLKISFEEILNSQRFTVFRNPEVFDRDLWNLLRVKF
jgi:hypothetical protein